MPGGAATPIGVMLPTFDPFGFGSYPVAAAARRAEALGYDDVWAGDHLAYHAPSLDCPITLAAAATATQRVRVGSAVLLGALRAPALVAREAAALDRLSGGRFDLGLGVGGESPAEYAAVGVDPCERGARLDDLIDVLPSLWSGEPVRFRGRALELSVPALRPRPIQRPGPPIWVGGRSPAARRRAARRAAGWLPVWMSAPRLRQEIALLGDDAAAAGRSRPAVRLMVFANVGADPVRCREEAALLVRAQYDLPLERLERWAVLGEPARLEDALAAAREAGADGFVLHAASPDWEGQYERWAECLELQPGATA